MPKELPPSVDDCAEMSLQCACHNLRRASRAMTQLFDAHFDEIGLKATQFTVLAALAWSADRPMPIGELAEMLVLDQSSLSRNLAVLERLGLLKLEPSPSDRRERLVRLTRSGRATLTRGYPIWKKAQAAIATALNDDLTRHLKLLHKLTRIALTQRRGFAPTPHPRHGPRAARSGRFAPAFAAASGAPSRRPH
ncbi:MAG: winged helix-turn-helix transcriptional regulator [Labilithrix sp.]|nr:winged helix-turn-helix transcriptional regulator [Labilithrix sp.]MCW5817199.1 winged helix-turn-helix transcriptional regulator [Labilithrix sp.]